MRKEENLELESQDKVKAFNPSTQEQRQISVSSRIAEILSQKKKKLNKQKH